MMRTRRKTKWELCEKCRDVKRSRDLCTACWHRYHFSPDDKELTGKLSRSCLRCGLETTRKGRSSLVCRPCHRVIHMRFTALRALRDPDRFVNALESDPFVVRLRRKANGKRKSRP